MADAEKHASVGSHIDNCPSANVHTVPSTFTKQGNRLKAINAPKRKREAIDYIFVSGQTLVKQDKLFHLSGVCEDRTDYQCFRRPVLARRNVHLSYSVPEVVRRGESRDSPTLKYPPCEMGKRFASWSKNILWGVLPASLNPLCECTDDAKHRMRDPT